ncbi:MAG TPA: hypothetical protein VM487_07705 [Phycisphaerae bacterium]|nr:hypothetical protein [Phycisphaerae bacterium]
MEWLANRYAKHPIAPRRSLTEFDVSALESFRAAAGSGPVELPTEDIGTEELFWGRLEEKAPGFRDLQITLFVTYYSNPGDPVPHTPEVCARQVGITVSNIASVALSVPGLGPNHPPVPVRVVDFEKVGTHGLTGYVFCANGEFRCRRDQVRWIIGRPGDRYVYFSKIEAILSYAQERDRPYALEVCQRLLSEALPVLVAEYFPDSADLKGE